MFEVREILTLCLGFGVIFLTLLSHPSLREIPNFRPLATAYGILLGSWVATNAESVAAPALFNCAEHVLAATAACVLLAWIWFLPAIEEHGG